MTGAVSCQFLLELTYDDKVYYSEKENNFHVTAKPCEKEGYMKVNTLRHYWKDAQKFDDWLRQKMELKTHPTHREDHKIWEDFQFKFSLTFELYNYMPFFEKCLYRTVKEYVRELSTVVELRHIFGCLFDDDGPVSLEREIELFERMQKNI